MQPQHRHIAIVCNAKAGKGLPAKLLPQVELTLSQNGFSHQHFSQTLPNDLNQFTDLLIMGGDGTINHTLNHFKNISIPIGLIRCGTGNDFSDFLLGQQSFKQQIYTALFAQPKPVDAGECNNRIFINGIGIGFDGWIVKRLLAKSLFTGKAVYYSTVVSLLLFYREQHITYSVDGQTITTPLFMFSGANAQSYGGGFKVAPKADVQDGMLECILVNKVSLLQRLRYLPVIEKGHHLNKPYPFIRYTKGKQIHITSTTPLHAHLDGEYMVANTFEIKILPAHYLIRF